MTVRWKRLVVVVAAALVLAVEWPGAAHAVADVSNAVTTGELTIRVRLRTGPDGDHGILIEPFEDNRFRVRQDQFGRPAFTTLVSTCIVNPIFNDVVCTPRGSSVFVTTGDGADIVRVLEDNPAESDCVEFGTRSTGRVEVNLGDGDDDARVVPTSCAFGTFPPSSGFLGALVANGGIGNDTLIGGPLNDELNGAANGDFLDGRAGNDILFGGSGSDSLLGREGNDELRGESGNDFLEGDEGNDKLLGGSGDDDIDGGPGNDALSGGDGDDEIDGGSGGDALAGGEGSDFLRSRDGERDLVDCGEGVEDVAELDLQDAVQKCEAVARFALDDGPPGRAVGRTLRLAGDGTAMVRIACPRRARVACRGTLTARLGRFRGPIVAREPYVARLGGQTAVSVRLGRLSRGTRVFIETVEQGVSKLGRRRAIRLFTIS